MTTWFITRHPGARHWAAQQQLPVDCTCTHLDPADVVVGDIVIGSLPVHLAAAVCARGARYLNLSIDLPANARGKELSAEELGAFNARLEEYRITPVMAQAIAEEWHEQRLPNALPANKPGNAPSATAQEDSR